MFILKKKLRISLDLMVPDATTKISNVQNKTYESNFVYNSKIRDAIDFKVG